MNMVISAVEWNVIGPEIILSVTAMALMLIAVLFKKAAREAIPYLGLAGIAAALLLCSRSWGETGYAFSQMVVQDNYSLFFKIIFLLTAGMTILLSIRFLKQENLNLGEYYVLLLFATVGMMLMASAADLIIIFLGLETFSLAVYVLAGFFRTQPRSNESSLKYFLLGSFSTGFLLYGIALIYGATGTTHLKGVYEFVDRSALLADPLLLIGMGLLIVGFGFKVASVPFHMWTPDVYEGAPTSVTAFMSVGPKAAGFAAFLRVFLYSLSSLQPEWVGILWVLAVLTMTLGNIVAIAQSNIKRMLAYSSIAHAGYILIAMVAGTEASAASILYYLLAYAFMNLGAFGVVILYGRKGEENVLISDYSGMGAKYPLLAAAMAVFMFSLAGIPPTAGFVGKFYIFSAAVKSGYIGLAVIGVLNSALSVYYYLRVTVMMYMRNPEKEMSRLEATPALVIALSIAVFGTLQMGITPAHYLDLARQSILALM
ncbi:MAG TPA: NADH-quinone oxidoreductase subunit N [Thermodesulfobacteriota bacterium]|nr:NADH-quinone oxidoreductase subunit N [Thermodesulfobacteriota bacterium]